MSHAACTFWTLIVLFAFFALIERAIAATLKDGAHESVTMRLIKASGVVIQSQGAIVILLPWVIIWWIWTWS